MDKNFIPKEVEKRIWDSCQMRANDLVIQFREQGIPTYEGALTAAFLMVHSIDNACHDKASKEGMRNLLFSMVSKLLDYAQDDSKHIKIKI